MVHIIRSRKNVNKLEEDGRTKNSSASFQDVGQAGAYTAWPAVYKATSSSALSIQVSGQVKISKQAIYFFLSNRARIWAFFGESAHEAARPPKSIWGCPPRLRLWVVQAAFKRALAGPAAPTLAWIRAWLFLKKLKCDFEKQKSNGSLDIRALAAQRPPTRRPTIAGAHRRPDTRPKEPFLGLKRRETKQVVPLSQTKNGHAARFSGSVDNGWKGRF